MEEYQEKIASFRRYYPDQVLRVSAVMRFSAGAPPAMHNSITLPIIRISLAVVKREEKQKTKSAFRAIIREMFFREGESPCFI